MHLGEKLKLYRREKDLDQFQMAEKLEVSHRKYQEIEKTGIIQKVGDLKKIKEILEENAQPNAQTVNLGDENPTLQAIANLTKSIDRLVRTNENLSMSNVKLATTNERLANEVLANSGGRGGASTTSTQKGKAGKDQIELLPDTQENDSEKSPRKRKDSVQH